MIEKLSNRGDTIVEVLIAITVLSAVLGGAIVASNRNLTTTRATQERGEALKLVEKQLELLKAKSQEDQAAIKIADFCMNGLSVVAPSADPACTQSPPGGYTYKLMITYNAGIHTVRAEWDRIGGGDQNIEIKYKVVTP